jgi:hypothetical protein
MLSFVGYTSKVREIVMAEKFFQRAAKSMERRGTKGALHRQLHVPEGEPIPASKLKAAGARAKRTGNTQLAKRVGFAKAGRSVNK